ncbi:MAG: hypothetical protein AAF735_06940 [Myxococcota bacterium]
MNAGRKALISDGIVARIEHREPSDQVLELPVFWMAIEKAFSDLCEAFRGARLGIPLKLQQSHMSGEIAARFFPRLRITAMFGLKLLERLIQARSLPGVAVLSPLFRQASRTECGGIERFHWQLTLLEEIFLERRADAHQGAAPRARALDIFVPPLVAQKPVTVDYRVVVDLDPHRFSVQLSVGPTRARVALEHSRFESLRARHVLLSS